MRPADRDNPDERAAALRLLALLPERDRQGLTLDDILAHGLIDTDTDSLRVCIGAGYVRCKVDRQ
jgi:hypothetical protein